MRSESGTDLLSRLQAREDEAYLEFVSLWAPRIERDLLKRGFTPTDAYDLSFSCATQVLIKLDHYKDRGQGLSSWILTVARNYASDWRRKNNRLKIVPLELSLLGSEPPQSEPAEDGTTQETQWTGALSALSEVLAQLPPEDRKLLALRYSADEADFVEIGRELQIQENAARTRHHRILKKLKGLLEKDKRIHPYL